MGKLKIEAELTAYFKANIDNRIKALKEEITALKAVRVKMFGKHDVSLSKPTKPKRKLSASHKKALNDGRKKALAAKNGDK